MDSEEFCHLYNAKLRNNSIISMNGSCVIWTGGTSKKRGVYYGQMRVKFPGLIRTKVEYVHRIQFILKSRQFQLKTHMHVSHLCHNSLCVTPDHLNYEPKMVNLNRETCKQRGICTQHDQYPDCLLNVSIHFDSLRY